MVMEVSAKKVLIDTNVFIALEESGRILDDVHADMLRLCRELHFDLYCHPAQLEDLERDTRTERKQIQTSRFKAYPKLEVPPVPSSHDLESLDWRQSSENDRIDNLLLFALKRSAVSYLITEDKDMHKKAKRADLAVRVFTVEEFLSYLYNEKNRNREVSTECVRVKTVPLYSVPLEQEFFNSLRAGYGNTDFDKWYRSKSEEGRKAWIVGSENQLDAFCMFKAEDSTECITDDGERLPGRVLKLCTFKVSKLGFKLGERLLFVAFTYAVDNHFDFVYIQVNENKQPDLVNLIDDFGFRRHGPYKTDVTYVKDMRKGDVREGMTADERLEYDIFHYPNYIDDSSVGKYLVPIQPTFHDRLFPDLERMNYLPGLSPEDSSEANAIKKAYICGRRIKLLSKGDVLLFYRSRDRKCVSCIGIVEDILQSRESSDLIPFVTRRTVFFDEEIRNKVAKGPQLAVLFRVVKYLKHAVRWSELKKMGVKGAVQSIRALDHDVYIKLFGAHEVEA